MHSPVGILIIFYSLWYDSRQLAPPIGYDDQVYGPWPAQGAYNIKGRVPPSWKSTRNPANYHTVNLLLAAERDPAVNPLLMGPGMEQLLDWHCTCRYLLLLLTIFLIRYCICRSGIRTNASCCHRDSFWSLLCCTESCNSAKIPEPLMVDTAR